jgi:branched-subunit amino acid permease
MRLSTKTKADNRLTVRRATAFALLVCFAAAMILSQMFVIALADHDHNHNGIDGGCAICAQLSETRGRLGHANALARISAVLLTALAGILIASADFMADRISLVHLKTQLNN